MLMRRLLLLPLCLATTACNRQIPRLNPYDGLVPAGFSAPRTRDPIDVRAMRERSVAIVTSSNFEEYSKLWLKYFGKHASGLEEARSDATATASGKRMSRMGASSDPRIITDEVAAQLRARFREVLVASDFADARDRRADYVALVDFWFTSNPMGNAFHSSIGFYLLDASLTELVRVEEESVAPRTMSDTKGAKAFDMLMASSVQALRNGIQLHMPNVR